MSDYFSDEDAAAAYDLANFDRYGDDEESLGDVSMDFFDDIDEEGLFRPNVSIV